MSCKDLPLTLKSDTFYALSSNFDSILNMTLRGMRETEQDYAEINIKVKITLTSGSAPDYSVRCAGPIQTREITKPKFDHTITAVIQHKAKKTGSVGGNYELAWDNVSGRYVMRPIDDGQTSMFDKEA